MTAQNVGIASIFQCQREVISSSSADFKAPLFLPFGVVGPSRLTVFLFFNTDTLMALTHALTRCIPLKWVDSIALGNVWGFVLYFNVCVEKLWKTSILKYVTKSNDLRLKLNFESVVLNFVALNFGLWHNSLQTDSKLSRIARLGFREHHQRGNLDCGWQPPYTVNMLFLSGSLHSGAFRQPNPISSLILPQIFSLLKHPSVVISLSLWLCWWGNSWLTFSGLKSTSSSTRRGKCVTMLISKVGKQFMVFCGGRERVIFTILQYFLLCLIKFLKL